MWCLHESEWRPPIKWVFLWLYRVLESPVPVHRIEQPVAQLGKLHIPPWLSLQAYPLQLGGVLTLGAEHPGQERQQRLSRLKVGGLGACPRIIL